MKKILIIYILFGIYLSITDPTTLCIYLTVTPIQYLLWKKSLGINNMPIILIFSLFLISVGLGSVSLYIDRANAKEVGFGAVGNFDFSYKCFFSAYSYILVYLISLLYFSSRFTSRLSGNYFTSFLRTEMHRFTMRQISLMPLMMVSIVLMSISIYMYSNNIGIVGLNPTKLPFHMTGVLIQCRKFLFTIVMLYLFARTKDKNRAIFIIIVYALVVGVTGSSKSLNLMLLAPASVICFLCNKKKAGVIAIICTLFIYIIVGRARSFIFESEGAMGVGDVFASTFYNGSISNDDTSFILYMINGICGSLFGPRSFILSNQYTGLHLTDLFNFYTKGSITDIMPDMAFDLFGIILPQDKAYGVSVGHTGAIVLLSCHNYIYTIIQGIIIAAIFSSQNNNLQAILGSKIKRIYKYAALGIVFMSLLYLLAGNEMFTIYILTLIIYLIRLNKNKLYEQSCSSYKFM